MPTVRQILEEWIQVNNQRKTIQISNVLEKGSDRWPPLGDVRRQISMMEFIDGKWRNRSAFEARRLIENVVWNLADKAIILPTATVTGLFQFYGDDNMFESRQRQLCLEALYTGSRIDAQKLRDNNYATGYRNQDGLPATRDETFGDFLDRMLGDMRSIDLHISPDTSLWMRNVRRFLTRHEIVDRFFNVMERIRPMQHGRRDHQALIDIIREMVIHVPSSAIGCLKGVVVRDGIIVVTSRFSWLETPKREAALVALICHETAHFLLRKFVGAGYDFASSIGNDAAQASIVKEPGRDYRIEAGREAEKEMFGGQIDYHKSDVSVANMLLARTIRDPVVQIPDGRSIISAADFDKESAYILRAYTSPASFGGEYDFDDGDLL